MNQEDGKLKYDFLYFLKIFLANVKFISIFTTVIVVITLFIVFFVLDPIFLSTTVVKTSTKSNTSGLSSLLGEGIPDFADIASLSGGGASSKEMALYEEILMSRRNITETLLRFKLNDDWKFKYTTDAIKNFRENVMEIKKNKLAGTMEIGINDKSPERAKEIGEFIISQLNKISTELSVQNAKNNREFIEKRFLLAKVQLKNAEDSIKMYQDRYGLAPDIVAKASVQGELLLETQIKSEEIKLEILLKILSPNESEVKMQQEKIILLQKQLSEIKNNDNPDSGLSLKGKPQVVIDYYRLQRNIEIQNKIVIFLLPIYEQAKIEENKEMPSVIVLDAPNIPEGKIKPKRLITTIVAMFFSIFLSLGFFIARERFHNISREFKKTRLHE